MSFFIHYFAAVGYAVIGYVVAVLVPAKFPEVGPELGVAFGGLAALTLLFIHIVRALGGVRGHVTSDMRKLRRSQIKLAKDIEATRAELRQIHDAVEATAADDSAKHRFESISAEVKVLQELIEQLATAGSKPRTRFGSGGLGSGASAARPANANIAGVAASAPGTAQGPRPASPGQELPPVAEGLDDNAILEVLREGLKSDRVELVLQPVVTLPQRKHRFYECYSRIHDGSGRIVVPEQYLDVACESGLIAPIDNMLLFRCVQLIRRARKNQQDVGFFCNISSHSLGDTPFLNDFISFMAENAELAPNLIFELAQADVANMDESVIENLSRLGELGFRFSMDQVETLAMDYAELARHNFRFIKVDAATLLELAEAQQEGNADAAVAGDVDLHDFKDRLDRIGMDLIVEKIEEEREVIELLDFNIDYGQGFLFGEPRFARSA